MRKLLAISAIALLFGCASPPPAPPVLSDQTAIRGHIVTPERVIRNGWIVIQGGKIASIGEARPAPAPATVLETDDYVFPTFVDLHNHPMYNLFARWKPPRQFGNRYEWRADPDYMKRIATPQREMASHSFCEMVQFAEVQMLIAGTGATTGIGPPRDGMPKCIAGLVRNLDWHSGLRGEETGNERVRTMIGVTSDIRDEEAARQTAADLAAGRIDALVIHLAEGKRSDAATRAEFKAMVDRKLLAPQTVLVHAISLDDAQLDEVRRVGASLVWSPRSNFELYGETLDVLGALRRGIPVALAPDWAPTGSINMLEEMRYAMNHGRNALGGAISARQLFAMATLTPAKIAGVDAEIGSLAHGKRADLFLVRNRAADAYEALMGAPVTDISLVMIEGVPVYGEAARLTDLKVPKTDAIAVCGAARQLNSASLTAGRWADAVLNLLTRLPAYGVATPGQLTECPP
jgi:cytosine/adenosine deaminase-related metal-dependent hydrolase